MIAKLSKRAQRNLAQLARADAIAILDAIETLAATGRGDVRKLHGISPPTWRLRVGRFRVIHRREPATLWVERIVDRRDAYRG